MLTQPGRNIPASARSAHRLRLGQQRLLAATGRKRKGAPPATAAPPADREPGFLSRGRVSELTRSRYLQTYDRFVSEQGKIADFVRFPRAVALQVFDVHLEQYIELLYDRGTHKAEINCLVAAITHLCLWPRRDFGNKCHRAAAAVAGWAKAEPDRSKEPCPWILATLIAKRIVALSSPAAPDAARGVILQFAFYLRPIELIQLPVEACFGGEGRRGRYDRCAVVVASSDLPAPQAPSKTGTFDDTVVLDEAVIDVKVRDVYLAALRDARIAGSRTLLRGLTYREYHGLVTDACAALRLPVSVTPHMFRHGAASEDYFRKLRDLPCIQQRGRWLALSSVQRY